MPVTEKKGKPSKAKSTVAAEAGAAAIGSDIRDLALADAGRKRIEWADTQMPVLREVRRRFEKEQSLRGIRIAACLHVTTETANLMRTFKAGGAEVVLCASNPLSTQDDAAASLVRDYGIGTYAIRGEDTETFYKHIDATLALKPTLTLDDGADLVSRLHTQKQNLMSNVIASMEETTTGVNRLRAMEKDGALKIPVISVNDALTKYLFDNRYGTGQSTIDGIIRATNVLMAGRNVVVAGYGWCGRGVASRARGLGSKVIVTETNPIRALEATMDGFEVRPIMEAASIGDIFITLTGNTSVLRKEHFQEMKSGAIICNSGHFNVELDLQALGAMSKGIRKNVRDNVDAYDLRDGRTIFLLGEGRLVNLTCAEGHPASVMDMSFATQALASEWCVKNRAKLKVRVLEVPAEVEDWIARLKLKSLGVGCDELTPEQSKYLAGWKEGT